MSAVCIKSSIPTLQPMPENFDAKVAIDYRSEKQLGVFY